MYPEVIAVRNRTGDTNISLNPFATNRTFYGESVEVFSGPSEKIIPQE